MTTSEQSKIGMVLRVTSGNFLEMFDFFLSGVFASYIAKAFFPLESQYASLLLTFVAFGAGFLMRPLGAIFLGAYVDRIGRRKGLIVTLSIMACGTVLIAFVPSYATIGIAAPLLVLIGRLLQGFSAGVELGGVSVYLSEMATPGHKGFYASWQSASQQVAIIVSAAFGFALNAWLSPQQIDDWGWRIPFFVGCMIVPFVFFIRRSLQETEEFLARKHHPTVGQIYRSILANWAIVLCGMMMVIMTTVLRSVRHSRSNSSCREPRVSASSACTKPGFEGVVASLNRVSCSAMRCCCNAMKVAVANEMASWRTRFLSR